jgi:hypothetical protein
MVSMAHLPESSGLIGVMALASMVGMARMVGLTGTVWPLTLPPFTLPPLAYLPLPLSNLLRCSVAGGDSSQTIDSGTSASPKKLAAP